MFSIQKISLLFKKLRNADIVKVFSFSAVSTVVKMATGLISIKAVALIVGPEGIAMLGQLNNFSGIVLAVATGGIGSGITKFVSEYKTEETVKKYVSTALIITVFSSLICAVTMVVFSKYLSQLIFRTFEYRFIFIIFGCTILFYALNMMFLSILNGFKLFAKFVRINIISSLVGLIFTLILVYSFELDGALISVVTYQSVVFFLTVWFLRNEYWFTKEYFKEKWDKIIVSKYLRFSIMTLVSVSTVPITQLILRSVIIEDISTIHAGWWEGMNRISNMYLTIITTSFSVYYLPKLSEIKDKASLKNEIFKAYKFVIPLLVFISIFVYLFRLIIIKVLFSDSFLPMEDLFLWQLLGDFFKIASWLLAYLMVAKSMTVHFISTEIIFSGLFLVLGYFLLKFNGVVGLTQAYFINYFIYMLLMIIFFRKLIFVK